MSRTSICDVLTDCFELFVSELTVLPKKKIVILRIYVKPVDVTLILLCLRKEEGLQSQGCSALDSA